MSEKVVITGMSLITSLGLSLEENWNNIVSGKSGVKKISLFDAASLATRIAAEIPPEFEELSKRYIKKRACSQMTRVTRMCVTAAKIAVADSGVDFEKTDRMRCSVIMGVVSTGNSSSERDT